MKPDQNPWPYPLWIAHRGAGKHAPENTVAAFRLGALHGFRMFECDVKLSADGVPFLLHDATLDRTTSGRGRAADLPWVDLAELDAGSWHSSTYAGEPLPSFEQIARLVIELGCALNVEIKPTPGQEAETGAVVAREAARLWRGQSVPPLLSSFEPDALRAAQRAEPELPRALLLDKLWPGWPDVARELGCVAIVGNWRVLDAAVFELAGANGWRVLSYTVNDEIEAQRLRTLGIAGLITDKVDELGPGFKGPQARG
jgi:glycerophosphoryl diester phosphodiesterase